MLSLVFGKVCQPWWANMLALINGLEGLQPWLSRETSSCPSCCTTYKFHLSFLPRYGLKDFHHSENDEIPRHSTEWVTHLFIGGQIKWGPIEPYLQLREHNLLPVSSLRNIFSWQCPWPEPMRIHLYPVVTGSAANTSCLHSEHHTHCPS